MRTPGSRSSSSSSVIGVGTVGTLPNLCGGRHGHLTVPSSGALTPGFGARRLWTVGAESRRTQRMTTSPVPGSLTHRQIMMAFSGLMIGMFIAAVDQTIVATAIPAIVSDLGGIAYLSWIVVGYLLTSTASTPLWGKVGDLFGRRRMFQTAIVIFLVGSLMCGLAPTMLLLIVGRLVQGVGGGGLYALCFGIVGDLVPPRQRGKYISYFAGMFAVAGVLGPLAGG